MGLLKKVMAAGVVKKVYDEARKPHNQKKMRDAYASFQARRGGQQSPPASGPGGASGPKPPNQSPGSR